MPGRLDILFIDPPWVIENDANIWKHVRSCWPSLGIAYIASYLEQFGFSCEIIDCTAEQIAVSDFKEKVNLGSPRFVGITATTPLIMNGLRIAEVCKQLLPDVKIIFGGVHPTVLPEDVLKAKHVDFVVRGEGEETVKVLLKEEDPENILGLSYKSNGKIVHNPDRLLIQNLDVIPPPAYHLLPMDKYHPAVGSYKRLPAMSVLTTRGCPGKCTFCYRIFGNKVRCRSAQKLIEEIRLLQSDYDIKEVGFYDDTFTVFKKVVTEFCSRIISERIDLTWSCFSRIDYVDEELLQLMKKAGCHLILFGIESGDRQILKIIRKKINLDRARETVRAARKKGIETRASYMFGNPGETEESIKNTMRYAMKLDTDEAQFNIATPYPGTEFFDWAKNRDFLTHTDWSRYHVSEQIVRLPSIEPQVLSKYYKTSHLKYYLRPKVMFRRVIKIRSFNQLNQEVSGLLSILKVLK